ncbi:ThuA domain-containing protein [Fretibacter rubidus]|uniref:ThuA domain-containing protein n=1 Tax=Fretibacter rubidus TaxID=570162 RepID=UPI00352AEACD
MTYFKMTIAAVLGLILTACQVAGPIEMDTAPAAISIHDQSPPTINQYMASPSILVFSKTREWRHEEGIAGGNLHFLKLGEALGYGVMTTQNGAIFNARDLAKFKIVVFNSATGDTLSPAQEAAFEAWMRAGGGVILIHGAGDSSHQGWPFYHNELLGTTFVSHPMAPQFQAADVHNLATTHPVMHGVPAVFSFTEEWYTFDSLPTGPVTVLAGLDESTYSPVNTVYGDVSDLRMGPEPSDHPIIWARCIDDGRMVYSALGHLDIAFDVSEHQTILKNAVNWVSGTTDPDGAACPR